MKIPPSPIASRISDHWPYVRKLADRMSQEKRLTDSELAAEYHAQDAKCRHEQWIETVRGDDDYEDWERAAQSRMYEQLTAIHRFATIPAYDEPAPDLLNSTRPTKAER